MKKKAIFLITSTIISLLLWGVVSIFPNTVDLIFAIGCGAYGLAFIALLSICVYERGFPDDSTADFMYNWFVIAINSTVQYLALQEYLAEYNIFLRIFIGIVAAITLLTFFELCRKALSSH